MADSSISRYPSVFGKIPFLVGVIQDAPLDGGLAQRVGQALEYGVAIFAAVAVPAQCGECGGVGSIVGTGEAAFGGEIAELGIGQPGACHGQHAPGFSVVARLSLELADANQIIQRGLGQGLFQSGAGWVGRGRD